MPVFEELPDDNEFRVVKWFDRFRLPNAGTRSASVDVLFQRLALQNVPGLNRLDKVAVQAVLGSHDGTATPGTAGAYECYPLLAGYVPHLRIGSVYKTRQYVGQLPTARRHITLTQESPLIKATIGDRLTPPLGWNDRLPYRPMTAKQYGLPFKLFRQSKCLYFQDLASDTEYIIPRSVIFRTFYASHTLLANAFTRGPWIETANSLISECDFKSGLKTRIDPDTGAWDIVLTPHVPEDDLARILALLWFDPYARKCADSLYTNMLQDAERTHDHVWFTSADIPLKLDGSTLAFEVQGFDLLPRMPHFAPNSGVPRHTFLVTSITSFPWPAYAPAVRWEKTNSSAQGETQSTDPRPRPYSGAPRSRPAKSNVNLTSGADASPRYPQLEATEDRISIIGAPPLEKMSKQNSIHYEGGRRSTPNEPNTSKASSGTTSYGVDAQQPIHHKTIVRNRISSFAGLLDALTALPAGDDPLPVSFSVIQPKEPSAIALAIGTPCWDFLSTDERRLGEWPRHGWKMVREHRHRAPRAALILHITFQDQEGYWIEIEPRTTSDAMCSPFLIGVASDVQEALQSALGTIAKQGGHNLQGPLEAVLAAQGGGRVRCFRHRYATNDHEVAWSVSALKSFLTGAFHLVESSARDACL